MVAASVSMSARGPQTAAPKPADAAKAPAQPTGPIARYTATLANVNRRAGENIKIDLLRWSTDAERDQMLTAVAKDLTDGPKDTTQIEETLWGANTIGYVWTSESLGYPIRFAQKVPSADGERVVLGIDRRLGSWDGKPWEATTGKPSGYTITIVELRLNKRGEGEGKMSLTTKIVADTANKAVTLEDYASAPVVLKTVKRDARTSERSPS